MKIAISELIISALSVLCVALLLPLFGVHFKVDWLKEKEIEEPPLSDIKFTDLEEILNLKEGEILMFEELDLTPIGTKRALETLLKNRQQNKNL